MTHTTPKILGYVRHGRTRVPIVDRIPVDDSIGDIVAFENRFWVYYGKGDWRHGSEVDCGGDNES